MPAVERAGTIRQSADEAKGTWRLAPVRTTPSSVSTAVICTPEGPELLSGSSQAGVMIASPAAMRGSHEAFCASDPPASSTPVETTELAKWGDGTRLRPNSSYTTTASSRAIPEPLYASGTIMPVSPMEVSWDQKPSSYPLGSFSRDRTESAMSAQRLRTAVLSMSCSSLKSRSMSVVLRDASRRRVVARGCRPRRPVPLSGPRTSSRPRRRP